jgi:hypothetical protein
VQLGAYLLKYTEWGGGAENTEERTGGAKVQLGAYLLKYTDWGD